MNDVAKDTNGNGATRSAEQFALQKIYVKDMSFEAPNAPSVFTENEAALAEPQIQLNLKNSHSLLSDDDVEVVLHASLHAKIGDRTLFMVEIDQAGLFLMKGFTADARRALIGTQCPSTLFPYLREAVSSMIGKGGFPALLLQPINFDALFVQAMQEQNRQAAQA